MKDVNSNLIITLITNDAYKYWFSANRNKLNDVTGFNVIDDLIDKAAHYGYLHHIERLMYIGNFMLINQILPKDCFRWFMIFFVDSYLWVMYPNVYGMSQYSVGPLMMTRPYFSSSNFINNMSNYNKTKGDNRITINNSEYEWYEVWDALPYNFIRNNKTELRRTMH